MIMDTTMNDNYYWDLYLKDGRVIPIPPLGVEVVRRKLDGREVINTSNGSIPFSEVKTFEKSSRKKIDVKMIEEVAAAFGEPVYTRLEDGTEAIKSKWVKKLVPTLEYAKSYQKHLSYKRLAEEGGMVWIAFVLPVHLIDHNKHVELTPIEVKGLTK
jgi:hypothetical protein